jgi:hypothetical protein
MKISYFNAACVCAYMSMEWIFFVVNYLKFTKDKFENNT